MKLEPHYATDKRVYGSAPSSDLYHQWKHEDHLMAELKKLEPNAVRTYFPADRYHLISIRHETEARLWFEEISQHKDKQRAIITAIEIIRAKTTKRSIEQ